MTSEYRYGPISIRSPTAASKRHERWGEQSSMMESSKVLVPVDLLLMDKIRLTTKDDDYPIIYRVLSFNHPTGGAGFCPSTVWSDFFDAKVLRSKKNVKTAEREDEEVEAQKNRGYARRISPNVPIQIHSQFITLLWVFACASACNFSASSTF